MFIQHVLKFLYHFFFLAVPANLSYRVFQLLELVWVLYSLDNQDSTVIYSVGITSDTMNITNTSLRGMKTFRNNKEKNIKSSCTCVRYDNEFY